MFSNFSKPRGLGQGVGSGGSVGDAWDAGQLDQSDDMYSQMKDAQGTPDANALMKAAIKQRRMSQPGAMPIQMAAPGASTGAVSTSMDKKDWMNR